MRLKSTFSKDNATSEKMRRRAVKALKVLLALLLIAGLSYGALGLYASALLKREYNKIHQQGEPVFFSETAKSTVPDSENAALLYIKAAKEITLPKGYYFQIDAPQKQKLLALRQNQKVMSLVEQASRLTQSHFSIHYKGSPDNWVDLNLANMSDLARLIRLNAFESARQNRYKKAFREIGYINQLAARTANGNTLMHFLFARGIQGIGIKATFTLLQHARLTKSQAHACSRMLDHANWHQLFYTSMIGERTFNISSYEYMLSDFRSQSASSETEWGIDDSSSFKQKGFLTRPLLKMDEGHL